MNIHGYSPRVQRMRKFSKNDSSIQDNDSIDGKLKNEGHPTKIPGLRVRQAVEKFKVKDPPVDKYARRSSIPKLIPRSRNRTTSVDSDKGTYRVTRRSGRSSIDDTFDKIYVEAAIETDKLDDTLNEIATDIDDVDTKFEIVANAYERVEDTGLEKKLSKIPIKRFSSHHEKAKQNLDRRHSVHTNVVNNNIKKLSKKKINNIDNLDELLVEVDKKTVKIPALLSVVEQVQNKTNALISLQKTEDAYDDVTVTLVPHVNENNEPIKSYVDDQQSPQDLSLKVQNQTPELTSNENSPSIDLINEDPINDKTVYKESYILEHNGDIPLTRDEDLDLNTGKVDSRLTYKEEFLLDYDNIEIRPVMSKIALFEQRSYSSPKLSHSPEIEKPIENLEVKVSKKEEHNYELTNNNNTETTDVKERKLNATKSIETVDSLLKETENIKAIDNEICKFKLNPETPIQKSKSAAEIDSDGAQRQSRYSRLSSVEKLVQKIERNNKVCLIDAKEMPRKKSVSEKIALFEGKLSQSYNDQIPNKMVESIKSKLLNHVQNTDRQANKNDGDISKSDEDMSKNDPISAKIEELKTAKLRYGSMNRVRYIELNNGSKMPVIALGTALLEPELTFHVISAAIDLGYRAFDTAYIDGNEREIGEAIKYKIQDGTVTREDLFIINKLWSTFHRTDLVEKACRNSLEMMQLDYFDLYLIHNPMSFKEGPNPIPKIANVLQYSTSDYLDAWFGMERLVFKGLARSIGVSNFNSAQLARIVEKGKIAPVVNQVESHPYLSQVRLQEFCSVYNVVVQSYGVLGSTNNVLVDSLVRICAAGMNVEPAQTLIRFQLDMDRAVVVKASTAAHLWDNLQSTELHVDPTELGSLHALNTNRRMFSFKGLGDTHRNYPFNIPF